MKNRGGYSYKSRWGQGSPWTWVGDVLSSKIHSGALGVSQCELWCIVCVCVRERSGDKCWGSLAEGQTMDHTICLIFFLASPGEHCVS